MKQLLTLVLFICFFSTQISAQNYDLNNFKYRYQIFKSLNTNYNYSGVRQYDSNKFDYDYRKLIAVSSLERALNGNLNYNSYKSSDTEQSSENLNSYLNLKSSRSNYDYTSHQLLSLNNILNSGIDYNKTVTKYYKNKYFWAYNYGLRLFFSNNKDTKKDTLPTKSLITYRRTDAEINAGIGFGKGRIEDVTSAVNALFLLKDLVKEGIINGFSSEQHENLAKGIVQLLNKRYLGDNRFIYIDQVAMLDSICKANNLGTTNNHLKYFNVLYDNLLYSPYRRSSGKKLSFSFAASNTNSWKNIHSMDLLTKEQTHEITPTLTIDYVNVKQINSYFQRSFNIRLGATHYRPFSDTLLNGYNNTFIYGNFDILFQPNSRTIIQAGAFGRISQLYTKRENNYLSFDVNHYISATYFISRKLRLVANVNSHFSFNTNKSEPFTDKTYLTKHYFANFNTSLEYSIF